MPRKAIHKARQHLQVIQGIAELECVDKPVVLQKILSAVRSIDKLLVLIEELSTSDEGLHDQKTKP